MKRDAGKPRLSLLPWRALVAVAELLTEQAEAHGDGDAPAWRTLPDGERRYLDAAMRHLAAHLSGEHLDAGSGKPHLVCALASLLIAVERATTPAPRDSRGRRSRG